MSNILVGVTGGIAAYKVADIAGALIKNGHEVKIIMTESAKKFITPLTLATMSKHEIYDDAREWEPSGHIWHIELSKWSEVLAIVPATANTISKIATGVTDNLLTSAYLAMDELNNGSPSHRSVVICPAMNTHMWEKMQIQDHLTVLAERQYHFVIPPVEGLLACGDVGMGKLPSTRDIVEQIQRRIWRKG